MTGLRVAATPTTQAAVRQPGSTDQPLHAGDALQPDRTGAQDRVGRQGRGDLGVEASQAARQPGHVRVDVGLDGGPGQGAALLLSDAIREELADESPTRAGLDWRPTGSDRRPRRKSVTGLPLRQATSFRLRRGLLWQTVFATHKSKRATPILIKK